MVGICLLTLVPGVVGGTETYARAICRSLEQAGTLDYTAYVPSIAADASSPMPSRIVAGYPASRTTLGRLGAVARATLAPESVLTEMRISELDAMHYPLTTEVPRVSSIPTIITVHDLQHLINPLFFSRAERAYRRLIYTSSIRRATAVIAISEHVKNTLVDLLDVPAERVSVSHFGLDHERLRPAGLEREQFILYPANRWPHKNHDRLLEAFEKVRRERPELRLVLTGAGHVQPSSHPGVDVLGHVPRARLIELFQTASALVFPSLYEGFGQPPLEAMACGCPVASSNAAALPEVCGDAAVYFDPTDVESIANAIEQVLSDDGSYRRRGLERAALFTWRRSARIHEQVYRSVGAT